MAYLRSVDMPFLVQLQFTTSQIFWLLFCVLLGIGYAFLLYRPSALKSPQNIALFGLRSIAVALIAFLLFAPMVKFTGQTLEKPLIIIAQDNSASISISKPTNFNTDNYTKQLNDLKNQLSEQYDVKSFTLGAALKQGSEVNFQESLSDINALFKHINDQYAGRNIGAVILATDGIYNYGGNPEYEAQNLRSPIYTIALGDTIPKKDLLISNVNYNNVVYLDSDFQIEIALEAYQSKGLNSRLSVSGSSGEIFSKNISVTANEYRQTVPVKISANRKGLQRYVVNLSAVTGELSSLNNTHTFLVEVIDGSNKVLILANSPHPDVSALKQSIETNKNYESEVVFADQVKAADINMADLVIAHQLPSVSVDLKPTIELLKQKPVWYVLGEQSATAAFSAHQDLININSVVGTEEVTASINPDFYEFTLTDRTKTNLQNFGPLAAPFGNYTIKGQAITLFNQQVGKLISFKPLLFFSKQSPQKIAVLTGEGIWRWRLENFQEAGTHEAVDELVSKVVQYMVSKNDKRKFRVYPSKTSFDESEHIIFNAELYNEAYELVNTPDVSINIKSKAKTYPYLFNRTGNTYTLDAGTLPAGDYSYEALTKLGDNKYSAKGEFFIAQQQAEYRQTTANHQLLQNLSALNNGEVIYPADLNMLADKIRKNELIKTVSYEDKKFEELINFKLIFFLIIAMLSIEWSLRKRNAEI